MFVGLETEWSVGHDFLCYGIGVDGFWTDCDDNLSCFNELTKSKFKALIGMTNTPPTYTQEELDYISELEDRIEILQELCSDYVKIIEELKNGSKS